MRAFDLPAGSGNKYMTDCTCSAYPSECGPHVPITTAHTTRACLFNSPMRTFYDTRKAHSLCGTCRHLSKANSDFSHCVTNTGVSVGQTGGGRNASVQDVHTDASPVYKRQINLNICIISTSHNMFLARACTHKHGHAQSACTCGD
jgi:hypothetical protein